MVAPGRSSAVGDSSSTSSSSSRTQGALQQRSSPLNNCYLSSAASESAGNSSPMRNFSSASNGLYISAPGKIILFGEHAVVYGRTAIAGSIDLRTYASLFTSADGQIYLCLPDLDVKRTWMLKEVQKACERLAVEYPAQDDDPPPLEVIVPIAKKLAGICDDQGGAQHAQHLAILAFLYLLLGVMRRKGALEVNSLANNPPLQPPATSDRERGSASPTAQGKEEATGARGEPPSLNGDLPRRSSVSWDLLAVKVTIRFKLPPCVGLGSSGAFCVCLATVLLQAAGLIEVPSVGVESGDESALTWDETQLEIIRKWSAAAESLIHGRASGLDAAVCTYGGIASYKPGKRIENLQNVPNLKVVLVNSKVERSTSRMVQNVRERAKKFPKIVDSIFDAIDAISTEAAKILQGPPLNDENGSGVLENGGRSATLTPSPGAGGLNSLIDHQNLQLLSLGERSCSLSSYVAGGKRGSTVSAMSGDLRNLGKLDRSELDTFEKLNDLTRINNQMLIALGVGHAKVEQICTLLARYGVHPKMTGAGGGGCIFAFLRSDISQTLLTMIREELMRDGYEMWLPLLGGPGIICHLHKPEIFNTPMPNHSAANATTTTTTTTSVLPIPQSFKSGSGKGSSTSRSTTPATSAHHSPSALRPHNN